MAEAVVVPALVVGVYYRVSGFGFRVQGLGGLRGLGFRVWGFGFGV